ncbi:hypothetical protein B0H19DRAFT_1155885 [Mycena capillaripes]|nr:hypothetical protein B0H19DRAFT_1155885 [Mycena capillaripes]
MLLDTEEGIRLSTLELPYELVSRIFIYCLPLRRRVRPHRNRVPLNLAGVCSQWRAVALTTPQLWASIYIEFGKIVTAFDGFPMLFGVPDAEPVEDHTVALLDLWFTRSAHYPLSISLICSSNVSLPPGVSTVMAAHSARWGRIELAITTADFLEFNKSTGPFPSLESLSIQITDFSRGLQNVRVNASHNSPNLKALRTLFEELSPAPRTLTALYTSRATIENIFRILKDHPNLLHFGGTSWVWAWARADRRLVLPFKSLLCDHNFPKYLEAPALEHLEFSILDSSSARRLLAFLTRSGCQLTSLACTLGRDLSNEQLISCLAALPVLTTLQIALYEGVNRAARYEVFHRGDVLPSLRTVIVTETPYRPLYAPFVALLRARPALERAELHIWSQHADVRQLMPPPGPTVEAQFEALAESGLNLRVTTPIYAWPMNARDEDPVCDLDINVFGSRPLRPYYFSPF